MGKKGYARSIAFSTFWLDAQKNFSLHYGVTRDTFSANLVNIIDFHVEKNLDLTLSRVSNISNRLSNNNEDYDTQRGKSIWLFSNMPDACQKRNDCTGIGKKNMAVVTKGCWISDLAVCVVGKFNSWSYIHKRSNDWKEIWLAWSTFPVSVNNPNLMYISFLLNINSLNVQKLWRDFTWKKFHRNCRRPAAATWRRERHSGRWRHLTLRETIPLEICNVFSSA